MRSNREEMIAIICNSIYSEDTKWDSVSETAILDMAIKSGNDILLDIIMQITESILATSEDVKMYNSIISLINKFMNDCKNLEGYENIIIRRYLSIRSKMCGQFYRLVEDFVKCDKDREEIRIFVNTCNQEMCMTLKAALHLKTYLLTEGQLYNV